MNCVNHPERTAAAYCRECGKPLCPECIRRAQGSVFCAEHEPVTKDSSSRSTPQAAPFGTAAGFAPAAPRGESFFASPVASTAAGDRAAEPDSAFASPYTAPYTPPPPHHPGVPPFLAFLLGFIPGVGAICNGQYAKGLIHAVIFGLLVSAVASTHGPLDALLGIFIGAWVFYMAFEAFHTASRRRRGIPVDEFSSIFEVRPSHHRLPLGAVLLVVVGFLLLLETTDIISWAIFGRFWPVLLIVIGVYLLYGRTHSSPAESSGHDMEARQ